MKKKCCKCKKVKSIDEFNKNKSEKDGYNNICRECSNKRSRQYYEENKEKHKKTIIERNKKSIKENQRKYLEILSNACCVDCGESDPIVLDFDHKDNEEKRAGVGKLITNGCSWRIIEEEMKKCEIRCANCHRKKTAKQFGWYKDILGL